MDEAQINEIIQKLKTANWDTEVIDDELGAMLRSPEIIPMLAHRAQSADAGIQSEAAEILAKIQSVYLKGDFLKGLATKWLNDRAAAQEQLLDNQTDLESLVRKLQDPQVNIRMAAAETLGRLGNPAAVPHLMEALGDSKDVVYEHSIYALHEIAQAHEIPSLVPYLTDENVRLRIAAAYVLGSKGGKDAVRGLIDLVEVGITGSKPEYERARKELQLIGQPAVDALIDVLNERDEVLSQLAIEVLAAIGDERALPHIVAAMGDEDDQVYEAAMWGVSEFGEEAVPLLMDALKSENARLRAKAAEALEAGKGGKDG